MYKREREGGCLVSFDCEVDYIKVGIGTGIGIGIGIYIYLYLTDLPT